MYSAKQALSWRSFSAEDQGTQAIRIGSGIVAPQVGGIETAAYLPFWHIGSVRQWA
jgi:hypothetical protein